MIRHRLIRGRWSQAGTVHTIVQCYIVAAWNVSSSSGLKFCEKGHGASKEAWKIVES